MNASKEELKLSKTDYKFLINNFLDVVVETNSDGTFIYVSPQVHAVFGYQPHEIIGQKIFRFIHPEDLTIMLKTMRRAIKSGNIVSTECKFLHKNGNYIFVSAKGSLVKNGDGFHLIGILRDITNSVETQQKLKESEEKFRTITEQSLVGISILQDYEMKYVNQKGADFLGYSIDEMKTWQIKDILKSIHPEDLDIILKPLKEREKGLDSFLNQVQYRVIRKNGQIIWLNSFSKLFPFNGRPADLIISIDITDRKKKEQKLKESEEKYHEAYDQANFYKDLFSHDINNVLNNIQSSIDLQTYFKNKPEKLKELNDTIKEQVVRATKLVSNVRKLSQLEHIQRSLQPTEVCKILKEAIDFLHKSTQGRKVNIRSDISDKDLFIQANELLLDVFENLLIDAVTHNENPIIEILIRISKKQKEGKNFFKFEFMDNGYGVPDTRKKNIFKSGYKNSKATKGMGFGLSLVKKIVDSFEGQIWVEDNVKGDCTKGSNFIILIPLAT